MLSNWIKLGLLSSLQDLKEYNKSVGVYKIFLDDEVIFIGKATENDNGGFRKRLHDYIRENDSARDTESGKFIFENKDNIYVEILVLDETEDISEYRDKLIKDFKPRLNKNI